MSEARAMTPTGPYLLRAFHQWILDNGCTPHLLVDATAPGVVVPGSSVVDGSIVLNVAPAAVRDLAIGAEHVSFNARFGGVAHEIRVPVSAVRAIYAKENGRGIVIPEERGPERADDASPCGKPPHLTLVK